MKRIEKVEDLGLALREIRKDLELDQARAAGLTGVGIRFLSELERGKENINLGKALQVLQRLGLELWIAPKGQRQEGSRNR